MNKIYRVIYNKSTQTFQAVTEYAKAQGKSSSGTVGSTSNPLRLVARLTAVALGVLLVTDPAFAVRYWSHQGSSGNDGSENNAYTTHTTSIVIGQKAGVVQAYPSDNSGNPDVVVIGYEARAVAGNNNSNGSKNVAIGAHSQAAESSTALGWTTRALGTLDVAIGREAVSNAQGSIAMGHKATTETNANRSLALGYEAKANANSDMSNAIGVNANTWGQSTIAIGTDAKAGLASNYVGSSKAVAIGSNANATGFESYALGAGAHSTGDYSIAQGSKSKAQGKSSFALGYNATSVGERSIAMVFDSYAGAESDIAIGYKAKATGNHSLAMVANSTASGARSIAIGVGSNASGSQSIAIGVGNQVSGNNAGAFGDPNTISGNNSYAVGNDNTINTADSFVLGNNVTNTVANSVFLGTGSNYTAPTAATAGLNEVSSATVNGITYNFAGGTTAEGVVSVGTNGNERRIQGVAAGLVSATSTDAINGSQLYEVANDLKTYIDNRPAGTAGGAAPNNYFHVNPSENPTTASGSDNNAAVDGIGNATGGKALAAGFNATASGKASIAIGDKANADNLGGIAIGQGAVSATVDKNASADAAQTQSGVNKAIAIGNSAQATNSKTVAIGDAAAASGLNAVSIGSQTKSTGTESTVVGSAAEAHGDYSVSIGQRANVTSTGFAATAIGNLAQASGREATALGRSAKAEGGQATAIGLNATAAGVDSIAMGTRANASAVHSVAISTEALATADQAIAIGRSAKSLGGSSVAIGNSAEVAEGKTNSVAIGWDATVTGSSAVALGRQANATFDNAVSIGSNANALNASATAIGQRANATHGNAIAMGVDSKAFNANTVAIGRDAHASLDGSVALGYGATTTAATRTQSATVNGVSYGNFAGANTNTNYVVSVGKAGAERQIQNVAAGRISDTSTDAINGSQLYMVADKLAGGWAIANATDKVGDVKIGQGNQVKFVGEGNTNVAVTQDTSGQYTVKISSTGTTGTATTPNNYFHVNPSATATAVTGTNNEAPVDGIGGATGGYALAAGFNAKAGGDLSVAIGKDAATDTSGAIAIGDRATAVVSGTTLADGSKATGGIAIGTGSRSNHQDTIAMGTEASSTNLNATAIGTKASASVEDATAIGAGSQASGPRSIALSKEAKAAGGESIALGYQAEAKSFGTALGSKSKTEDNFALAVGYEAQAIGQQSTAVGYKANTTKEAVSGIAVGQEASAQKEHAMAMGYQAVASELRATAIGDTARASAVDAIAQGTEAKAIARSAIATGKSAIASEENAMAQGTGAKAFKADSIAQGTNANAVGNSAVAIGKDSYVGSATHTPEQIQAITDAYNNALSEQTTLNASRDAITDRMDELTAERQTLSRQRPYPRDQIAAIDTQIGVLDEELREIDKKLEAADAAVNTTKTAFDAVQGAGVKGIAIGDAAKVYAENGVALGAGAIVADGLANAVALGANSTVTAVTAAPDATINGVTYGNFAGNNPSAGDVVSVGSAGKERRIQNVAAGRITADSTDAINGSQLYAVVTTGSWELQSGGNKVGDVNWGDKVNFTSADKSVTITPTTETGGVSVLDFKVNVDNKTVKVDPTTGNVTAITTTLPDANNDGKVDTPTNGDSLVNATTVADAINNSGFKLTATKSEGEVSGTKDQLIKSGETVTIDAGKNIKLTQADGKITVATKDDVTFNSVTVGTTNPITINNAGINMNDKPITNINNGLTNGANDLRNLDNNAVDNKTAATVGDLRNMGWVVSSNKTTGTAEGQPTNTAFTNNVKNANEVQFVGTGIAKVSGATDANGKNVITVHVDEVPTPTTSNITADASGQIGVKNDDNSVNTTPTNNPNNLVTANDVVNAVNNAFWKVGEGEGATATKKDDVKAGDTVNFANGTGTTANVSSDGTTTTVKYSVKTDNTTIKVDPTTGNITANTGDLTNTDGKVDAPTNGGSLVNATTVANAINNSGFKLTATKSEGEVEGTEEHLIKSGELMTVDAGKNIKLTQADGKITVATKDDVTFTNVTASNVTTGGTSISNDGLKAGDVTVTNAPITVNGTTVNNVNDAINQTATQAFSPLTFAGDSGNNVERKLGTTLNVKGGVTDSTKLSSGNIGVVANGSDTLDIKLAKDLKDIDSITINNGPTINGNGIDMNGDSITDVAGNLDGAKTGTTAPTTVSTSTPTGDTLNNAATVGDVLNAGWNLKHSDGTTTTDKDFVRHADNVVFANGVATTASVETTDGGKTSTIKFDVKTDNTTIKVDPNTGNITANTGDLTNNATTGVVNTPNTEDGKKLTTAADVADAINNSGFRVKSAGTNKAEGDEAAERLVKTGELVEFEAGDNLTVKRVGDKFTYATKQDVTFNSVTSNTVKVPTNVADKPITISSTGMDMADKPITNINNGLTTYTDAPKNGLVDLSTPTDGTAPAVANSTAATVGDLRNMGWLVSSDKTTGDLGTAYTDQVRNANEVKFVGTNLATVSGKTDDQGVRTITVDVDAQKVVETAQNPVVYTNAEGDKLTKVGDKFYKVDDVVNGEPKPDATEVKPADVIASMNNGGNSTTAPTTLANVEGNLDGAKTGTTAPTTNADKPTTLNNNNAATVGDVLNAGWNLQGNGEAKDFVRAYDTVNFVDGKGTKAVVEVNTDGTVANVTFNADTATITANDNGSVTGPVSTQLQDDLKKAQDELAALPDTATEEEKKAAQDKVDAAQNAVDNAGNQVATAQNVADAINKSGFNLKTSAVDGGVNNTEGDLKANGELINPSDTVEMIAGKNLTVKQDANGKVTYATKEEVEFTSVTSNTVKVPTDVDNPTVNPITINKDGMDMANKPITNVASNLPDVNSRNVPATNVDKPTSVNNSNAATVGDVLNAGWNLKVTGNPAENPTDVDFVSPYDAVNFKAGTGVLLGHESDGKTSTITISLAGDNGALRVSDGSTLTENPLGRVEVVENPTGMVNAGNVANMINKSGFSTTATLVMPNGDRFDGVETLINPGDQVNYVDGSNTKANVTVEKTAVPVTTFWVTETVNGKDQRVQVEPTKVDENGNITEAVYASGSSKAGQAVDLANTKIDREINRVEQDKFNVSYDVVTGETEVPATGDNKGKATVSTDAVNTALQAAKDELEIAKAGNDQTAIDAAQAKVDEAQKAVDNVNNTVATVGDIVETINNVAWFTNSTTAVSVAVDTAIKAGGRVNLEAGKNIEVTQTVDAETNTVSYTYSTKEEVDFNKVTVSNGDNLVDGKGNKVTAEKDPVTGDTVYKNEAGDIINANEVKPANTVNLVNEAGKAVTNAGTKQDATKPAPSALNITGTDAAGNASPTQITGVASTLNTTAVETSPAGKDKPKGSDNLVDLKGDANNPVNPTSAATVGDLQNMGWVVSAAGNEYKDTVKNANEVKFVGEGRVNVTGETKDGVREIKVAIKDQVIDGTERKNDVVNYDNGSNTVANVNDVYNYKPSEDEPAQELTKKADGNYYDKAGNVVNNVDESKLTPVGYAVSYDVVTGKTEVPATGDNKGKAAVTGAELANTALQAAKDALEVAKAGNDQTAIDAAQAKVDEAQKAVNNVNNTVATVGDIVETINNVAWFTNSTTATGGAVDTGIKAGGRVNLEAGKNIEVTQTVDAETNTVSYTYSTKEEVDFNKVTVSNGDNLVDGEGNKVTAEKDPQTGNTVYKNEAGDIVNASEVKPANTVNLVNEAGTKVTNAATGQDANKAAPSALNITGTDAAGNASPTQITGVASTLNTKPVETSPTGTGSQGSDNLVDLKGDENNPVNPTSAATVGDLQNMGWVVSASGNEYKDTVKNANEVKFVGTGLATVTGKTDGNVRTITVDVNAQNVVETAQLPVVYTNKAGDKVYKQVDEQGNVTFNTKPDGSGSKVEAGDVIASMNNGSNSTTAPMTLSNVASNLAEVTPVNEKQPDANSLANLEDKKNNAATVADVLNAGWNLQNNDTAIDTVTHNDAVNFVDGRATTVSVTANDDGTVNNIKVDVETDDKSITVGEDGKLTAVTSEIVANTNGSVGTPLQEELKKAQEELAALPDTATEAEKKAAQDKVDAAQTAVNNASNTLATAQNVADAINKSGFNLKTSATAEGAKEAGTADNGELINPSDTVEMIAGKNLTVKQDANGKVTYATKEEVDFNKVTLSNADNVVDGKPANTVNLVNEAGTKVTNTGTGQDATKPAPSALNITGTDAAGNASPTQITGVASTLNTKPVETSPTGKGEPKGSDNLVDLKGDENNPVNPTSAATVGDLQNMGWVVSASGNEYKDTVKNANEVKFVGTGLATVTGETKDGVRTITVDVNAQSTVENAQLPVVYTNKAGDKVYKQVDADGNVSFNTKPDGKGDVVQPADVIASMNNGGNSTTAPTTLANVASNLAPTTSKADGSLVNKDGTDGKTEDGKPTTSQAAPKNAKELNNNAATVGDVLNAGWNLQGNGEAKDFVKPYDTVNFVDGKGTKAVVESNGEVSTIKVDIDNGLITTNNNGSVTGPVTDELKKAVEDAKKALDADPNNQALKDDLAKAEQNLTNAGNQVATAQNVADAINGSGWNLAAEGTDGEELINPSDKVTFKAGDNLEVKRDGAQITYALQKDINVNSVTAGDTKVDNDGITINNGAAGNPVSLTKNGLDNGGNRITNVAPGVNPTDAVNVSQLKGLADQVTNVAGDANAGVSSAMAMAALPQAYLPGKSMLTGGVASYNGEGAVAVGFSKLSDNGRWVMKMSGSADTQGNVGGAVGAGFHF